MADSQSVRNRRLSLLQSLVEADGTSGREEKVREAMARELRSLCKSITIDALGNLIATREGPGPTIMLASHMDEVGLVVKHIRPDGYLVFELSGLIDASILPSQWIRISTEKGVVRGVIGARAGHLADGGSGLTHRSLLIDVGARSEAEVLGLGVKVGDFATYDRPLRTSDNGKYVLGKALDNRNGCTVMIETVREIVEADHQCHTYAVGTVMEEIGALGARVATNNLQPQLAIVLDGVPASDPYVPIEQSAVLVGHGPVIRMAELRIPDCCVTPKWLFDLAVGTAEEENIPYQIDVASAFFSDAYAVNISGRGTPTLPIKVPRQNSHSPAEVASVEDLEYAIKLTTAVVKKVSSIDIKPQL